MDVDQYQALVYGRTPQSWTGWRFTPTGACLVTPDGIKLSPERIKGVAWRIEAEMRRDAARSRNAKAGHRGMVTVVRVNFADWQRERFGNSAA